MQGYPDDGGATDAPDASTAAEGIAPAPEPVAEEPVNEAVPVHRLMATTNLW